ncbi:MAG: M81 family metallopeptidase [Caldilineaceae bacterium]|nr:M81 family metallopeptidase [Caldilineaceae bacterium]
MRILIAECKQEISSFNPVLSRYEDFEIGRGQEIVDYHRGLNTEMCGALDVFRQREDVILSPGFSIRAITSGGPTRQDDYERLAQEFLAAARAALPVDAVYVSLHGAMASEQEPDPEGFFLAAIRDMVGDQTPIVASFDLHGILTDRILAAADAIVAFHTYPHVDMYDTGRRAARLLLKIVDEGVKPVTAVVPIPALVRGNELITATGLIGGMIRRAQRIEDEPGGLSAGIFIGNPFTDVPDLRSNAFVVTDGDADRAAREATAMAEDFWAVHEQLLQPLISLEEAVQKTMANDEGTVILTDAADATSSGASGDSNAILAALMAAGYQGRLLTPIVDAPAVEAAMQAGIGTVIDITLGGQLDPARFTPLPVTATVRALSDGDFVSESNNAIWSGGLSALLQVGNHSVVVTSRPVSLYDRSLFWSFGQEPSRFDAVVVKSPHCQPHMFNEWGALVLHVDAPGSTSANLPYLGHTVCARPIFPLDEDVTFAPRIKLFQR